MMYIQTSLEQRLMAVLCTLAMSGMALSDLNGTVVFQNGLGGVANFRIPAIVQTRGKQPALVAFAEARDGGDASTSRIAVRTSTDAGATWSAISFAAGSLDSPAARAACAKDNFTSCRVGNPAVVWDNTSAEVVLAYCLFFFFQAKSAVYGIVVGKPTAVKVTVTDVTGVEDSYEVDATFNSTHQAFGPEFVGGDAAVTYPGPFQTWKAYLNPTKAGGNYTISAVCAGCTEDGSFSNINISNVAFGDVWHCSGQSNMWLPVGNAFGINDTLGNISAGNYNNIRVMAGNSGSGTTNPWMTAVQASVVPPQQGRGASTSRATPRFRRGVLVFCRTACEARCD